MKYLKNLLPLVLLLFTGVIGMNAQKIGYINYQAILVDLPDVDTVNQKLEVLAQEYQNRLQEIAEKRQNLLTTYENVMNSGQQDSQTLMLLELLAEQVKSKETEYVSKQQEYEALYQNEQQKLFKPIYEKINDVVKQVAKEKGFGYVIDNSTLLLVVKEEKGDLTELVRKKLGLPPTVKKEENGNE
jgi:outer membrane protein